MPNQPRAVGGSFDSAAGGAGFAAALGGSVFAGFTAGFTGGAVEVLTGSSGVLAVSLELSSLEAVSVGSGFSVAVVGAGCFEAAG